MSDVFICYSRRDDSFVRQLHEALEQLGRDTWVDWRDIVPSAEWMSEIYAAIEDANAFVFVLSPDSVRSAVCARELAHAAAQNKRIIPLQHREVDARAVPAAAARHHWISFDGDARFDEAFAELTEALDTDPEWIAQHTHWLRRALHWEKQGRDRSLLLRGSDLRSAEDWLAGEESGIEPQPTTLQREYVDASRRDASRRQRGVTALIAAALVVSIVLLVMAVVQRNQANDQKRLAQSLALTAGARETRDSDPVLSTRLAAEAITTADTPTAEAVLRSALARLDHRTLLRGHSASVSSAAFSPDGERVVTASDDGTARIWDARSGEEIEALRGHGASVSSAAFSPDGERVVTASIDGTARIWDARSGDEIEVLRGHRALSAAFSPDGERVVTASDHRMALLRPCGHACTPAGSLLGLAEELAGSLSASDRDQALTG